MKRTILLASLASSLVLLAACGEQGSESMDYSAAPPAPVTEMAESDYDGGAMNRVQSESKQAAGAEANSDLPQRAGRFLAYTYNRTISVPSEQLKSLIDTHAQLCMDAGPTNCLVTNSNVNGLGTEYARGYLSLKAAPDWALPFLDGLPDALEPDNASVTSSSTSAVDLTSQIIDTDAQLKAQKTLRDRLQSLLENRDGDLSELLSVERELARVQGQIDSYEANLASLRKRVSMSDIYLNYEARVSPVSRSVWRPLARAFDDFFSNVAQALASIVRLLPFLLVWLPVIFGAIWAFVWGGRKLFGKKSPKVTKPDLKDTAS